MLKGVVLARTNNMLEEERFVTIYAYTIWRSNNGKPLNQVSFCYCV